MAFAQRDISGQPIEPVWAAVLEARQGADPDLLSIDKNRPGDLPRPAKDTIKG